jgi:hypothetical protein
VRCLAKRYIRQGRSCGKTNRLLEGYACYIGLNWLSPTLSPKICPVPSFRRLYTRETSKLGLVSSVNLRIKGANLRIYLPLKYLCRKHSGKKRSKLSILTVTYKFVCAPPITYTSSVKQILCTRSLRQVMPSCANASLLAITCGSSKNPFLYDTRRQYPIALQAIQIAFSLA